MTLEDWCYGNVYNFCKPVAKTPADRLALLNAMFHPSGKFFFGSDSAPHHEDVKRKGLSTIPGCFTQPWCTALVIEAIEVGLSHGWISAADVSEEKIENFLSKNGMRFYGVQRPASTKHSTIMLERNDQVIETISSEDGMLRITPFRDGCKTWSLEWS